jgi:hypothetical protein
MADVSEEYRNRLENWDICGVALSVHVLTGQINASAMLQKLGMDEDKWFEDSKDKASCKVHKKICERNGRHVCVCPESAWRMSIFKNTHATGKYWVGRTMLNSLFKYSGVKYSKIVLLTMYDVTHNVDTVCAVCREGVCIYDRYDAPCGHWFHGDCINLYKNYAFRAKCPLCKHPLTWPRKRSRSV